MKTSIRAGALRRDLSLALAFALGALCLASSNVHAANLDPVTISALRVRVVGQDSVTGAPIERTTATAVVKFDPVTLTSHSGVALLEDSVRGAARRACNAAVSLDVQTCAIRAAQSAQTQVQAAIARARRDTNGS
jgi:hypothetical protein